MSPGGRHPFRFVLCVGLRKSATFRRQAPRSRSRAGGFSNKRLAAPHELLNAQGDPRCRLAPHLAITPPSSSGDCRAESAASSLLFSPRDWNGIGGSTLKRKEDSKWLTA